MICPAATGSRRNKFASGFGSKGASSEWGHPEDCLISRLKDVHTIHRCRVHHCNPLFILEVCPLVCPQNGLVECAKVVDRFCLSKMKKETQDCWPYLFERGLV